MLCCNACCLHLFTFVSFLFSLGLWQRIKPADQHDNESSSEETEHEQQGEQQEPEQEEPVQGDKQSEEQSEVQGEEHEDGLL